jgi:hypothetical protein
MAIKITLGRRLVFNNFDHDFHGNSSVDACLAVKEIEMPYCPQVGMNINHAKVDSVDYSSSESMTYCATDDSYIKPDQIELWQNEGWEIIGGGTGDHTDLKFGKYRVEFNKD